MARFMPEKSLTFSMDEIIAGFILFFSFKKESDGD